PERGLLWVALGPVGPFDQRVVGLRQARRVAKDRPIRAPQIAGEDERSGPAVLLPADLRRRGTRYVPRLVKYGLNSLERLERLLVAVGRELRERALDVARRIERLDPGLRTAVGVAVQEFGVLELDVRRVQEHGPAQVCRDFRRVDRSVESLLAEERNRSGMVDMGVREDHA